MNASRALGLYCLVIAANDEIEASWISAAGSTCACLGVLSGIMASKVPSTALSAISEKEKPLFPMLVFS